MSKNKTSRKRRKAPMVRRRRMIPKRALAILAVILIPIIVACVGYGLLYMPMVDYTFGTASDIKPTYQLTALTVTHPGTIDIVVVRVRNRGAADISVLVTLHAVNAEVSANYDGPYDINSAYQTVLPANTNDYVFVTFYITLVAQVPSFTLSITVSKAFDFSSFSSSEASIFGQINSVPFTSLQYVQSTAPNSYQLGQTT